MRKLQTYNLRAAGPDHVLRGLRSAGLVVVKQPKTGRVVFSSPRSGVRGIVNPFNRGELAEVKVVADDNVSEDRAMDDTFAAIARQFPTITRAA